MTGFRLLVDGALGNLSECFVSGLLFLEGLLQKRHGVFKAKLFRPSDERTVAGDFIVLYRLRGGEEAGIKRRRALGTRCSMEGGSLRAVAQPDDARVSSPDL